MPPLVDGPCRDAAAQPLAQLVDVDDVERRQLQAGLRPGAAVAAGGPQQVLDQPAQHPEVVAAGRAERLLARLVQDDGWLFDRLASGVGLFRLDH